MGRDAVIAFVLPPVARWWLVCVHPRLRGETPRPRPSPRSPGPAARNDRGSVPGSATWGNRITRVCTWARFTDRDGHGFWHFNLHLDHESQRSRERSTQLLVERIESRSRHDEPVIVTGDFNAGERNAALEPLVGSAEAETDRPPFVDTYRELHPGERDVGTYNEFTFGKTDGDKIDYVLAPQGTRILSAEIVRWSRNGRYPSDHFPVVARLRLER